MKFCFSLIYVEAKTEQPRKSSFNIFSKKNLFISSKLILFIFLNNSELYFLFDILFSILLSIIDVTFLIIRFELLFNISLINKKSLSIFDNLFFMVNSILLSSISINYLCYFNQAKIIINIYRNRISSKIIAYNYKY